MGNPDEEFIGKQREDFTLRLKDIGINPMNVPFSTSWNTDLAEISNTLLQLVVLPYFNRDREENNMYKNWIGLPYPDVYTPTEASMMANIQSVILNLWRKNGSERDVHATLKALKAKYTDKFGLIMTKFFAFWNDYEEEGRVEEGSLLATLESQGGVERLISLDKDIENTQEVVFYQVKNGRNALRKKKTIPSAEALPHPEATPPHSIVLPSSTPASTPLFFTPTEMPAPLTSTSGVATTAGISVIPIEKDVDLDIAQKRVSTLEKELISAQIISYSLYYKLTLARENSEKEQTPIFVLRYVYSDIAKQGLLFLAEQQAFLTGMGKYIWNVINEQKNVDLNQLVSSFPKGAIKEKDIKEFASWMTGMADFVGRYYIALNDIETIRVLKSQYTNMRKTYDARQKVALSSKERILRSRHLDDVYIRIIHHLIVGSPAIGEAECSKLIDLLMFIIAEMANFYLPESCVYIYHSITHMLKVYGGKRLFPSPDSKKSFSIADAVSQILAQERLILRKIFKPLIYLTFALNLKPAGSAITIASEEPQLDMFYMVLFMTANYVDPFENVFFTGSDSLYEYIAMDSFGDKNVLGLYRGRGLSVRALKVYRKYRTREGTFIKNLMVEAITGDGDELKTSEADDSHGNYEESTRGTIFQKISSYARLSDNERSDVDTLAGETVIRMMGDCMPDSTDTLDILSDMHMRDIKIPYIEILEGFLQYLLTFDFEVIYDMTFKDIIEKTIGPMSQEITSDKREAIACLMYQAIPSLGLRTKGDKETGLLQMIFAGELAEESPDEWEKTFTILLYIIFYEKMDSDLYSEIKDKTPRTILENKTTNKAIFDKADSALSLNYNTKLTTDEYPISNWVFMWSLHMVVNSDMRSIIEKKFVESGTDYIEMLNSAFDNDGGKLSLVNPHAKTAEEIPTELASQEFTLEPLPLTASTEEMVPSVSEKETTTEAVKETSFESPPVSKKSTVTSPAASTPKKKPLYPSSTYNDIRDLDPKEKNTGWTPAIFGQYIADFIQIAHDGLIKHPYTDDTNSLAIKDIINVKMNNSALQKIGQRIGRRAVNKTNQLLLLKKAGTIDSGGESFLRKDLTEVTVWKALDAKETGVIFDSFEDEIDKLMDKVITEFVQKIFSSGDDVEAKTKAQARYKLIKERLVTLPYRKELMIVSWFLLELYPERIPDLNAWQYAYKVEFTKYLAYLMVEPNLVRPFNDLEYQKASSIKNLKEEFVFKNDLIPMEN